MSIVTSMAGSADLVRRVVIAVLGGRVHRVVASAVVGERLIVAGVVVVAAVPSCSGLVGVQLVGAVVVMR